MNRRKFIRDSTCTVLAAVVSPRISSGAASTHDQLPVRKLFTPAPGQWRTFEVTTKIRLRPGSGASRVWIPLPSVRADAWMRPLESAWTGNANAVSTYHDPEYGAQALCARWDGREATLVLDVVSRFATRDRRTDWNRPRRHQLSSREKKLYTSATKLIPIDGAVQDTARQVVGDTSSDIARARLIYEWVVENSVRDPATRGCGLGDIATMLESGNLKGKCADINTLFVGMCRAVGIPARDVYGVRVADSRFGYRSLGKSGDITKAQHCRAEIFFEEYGWVPADPADVRKVVLEEQAGLAMTSPLVTRVREQLFGAWEGNWLAYNTAHDLQLPLGPTVPFLMYPHGQTAEGRLDSLAPEDFVYSLMSTEIVT